MKEEGEGGEGGGRRRRRSMREEEGEVRGRKKEKKEAGEGGGRIKEKEVGEGEREVRGKDEEGVGDKLRRRQEQLQATFIKAYSSSLIFVTYVEELQVSHKHAQGTCTKKKKTKYILLSRHSINPN